MQSCFVIPVLYCDEASQLQYQLRQDCMQTRQLRQKSIHLQCRELELGPRIGGGAFSLKTLMVTPLVWGYAYVRLLLQTNYFKCKESQLTFACKRHADRQDWYIYWLWNCLNCICTCQKDWNYFFRTCCPKAWKPALWPMRTFFLPHTSIPYWRKHFS